MSPLFFFHNLIWKFSVFNQFSKQMKELEHLKVLKRSPDLLNNVKIGQGQLRHII